MSGDTQERIRNLEGEVASLRSELAQYRRYKAIVEQAPIGIVLADAEQAIQLFNPVAARIYGMPIRPEPAPPLGSLFDPHEQARLSGMVAEQLAQHGSWHGQMTSRRSDGSGFTTSTHFATLRDAAGALMGTASYMRDITAEAHTANALRESEERLRLLLDVLPVIFAIIDDTGIFRFSAGRALADLGLQAGQVVGTSALDMYKDMPEIIDDIQRAIAGETMITLRTVAGMAFESRYSPFHDAAGVVQGTLLLATNVTDRNRAEQERTLLQEQVIQAQQAALRELSTPLIPLADDIVVMPLIGNIDSQRAQQIIETLLQGVAEQRARAAIIDITGVLVVDTQVANALLRAAQAVQLLGARVVLTGIRPEVAQTLVGLGTDLSAIVTRGTLQSGISYALERRTA